MMNKKLQYQLDNIIGSGATKEDIDSLKQKTYTSGREIQIGDKMLWGFLIDRQQIQDKDGIPSLKLQLINLHPEEYGVIYEDDEQPMEKHSNYMPFLKLKA